MANIYNLNAQYKLYVGSATERESKELNRGLMNGKAGLRFRTRAVSARKTRTQDLWVAANHQIAVLRGHVRINSSFAAHAAKHNGLEMRRTDCNSKQITAMTIGKTFPIMPDEMATDRLQDATTLALSSTLTLMPTVNMLNPNLNSKQKS